MRNWQTRTIPNQNAIKARVNLLTRNILGVWGDGMSYISVKIPFIISGGGDMHSIERLGGGEDNLIGAQQLFTLW